ncbi:MAG: SGNH/GDSL hydrolase family protein [Tyzzerella sp.]|nr:SGNH/GDSL hydrolase family protein [Tyzzerella sp.]
MAESKQKLNFEQIKQIAHGVARVEEVDGKIVFYRFTKEQQELYRVVSADFYMKSFSTSGVSLEFDTDSEYLGLSVSICKGSSRYFFTHSIFVNGERFDELSGEIEKETENVPFSKEFQLGSGVKRIRIVFPWSVASSLVALELDEGAKITPVAKNRKMLMFGDSITQGYDAMQPENAYAVQIATRFNAEARNKGIGAECFRAKTALLKDDLEPDIITVAYGTNDWSKRTKEEFETECRGFYTNLRNSYPNAKIYALAPVWRSSINDKKQIGVPLKFIAEYIKEVSESISDMTVIDCIDFIPHELENFQTDGLHPIDAGFMHYGKNLWDAIKE